MKHGHKKGKAKAPSGKKSKPTEKIQASQGGGSTKKGSSSKAAPARTSGKTDIKTSGKSDIKSSGKTDIKARGSEPGSFNNPVVGNAFKRAVKKYPSAFKRLTD